MTTDERARTHVLLPRDVLDAVDRLVGNRRRSQFLADAAREKLQRLSDEARLAERVEAARLVRGSLATRHIPEWDTVESSDAWVRAGRRERDERIDRYREQS